MSSQRRIDSVQNGIGSNLCSLNCIVKEAARPLHVEKQGSLDEAGVMWQRASQQG